jgi:hypothetical protein
MVLDANKGPGPDKIPPSILKNTGFTTPLSLIFNRSVSTSVFQAQWKLSFVTSLFKIGKPNDISNYRGISILSAVANIFDVLLYKYLFNDLNGLISENQHGFIKGRSTVSNLNLRVVTSRHARENSLVPYVKKSRSVRCATLVISE